MIDAQVIAHLKDGRNQALAAQFFAPDPSNLSREKIEDELLEFFSVQVGHPQIPNGPIAPIERIEIASLTVVGKDQPYLSPEAGSQAHAERCKTLLNVAYRLLPAGVREDALDEWYDEIECAAAQGKRVWGRTLSIIVRSLPILALRSRFPIRARGNGS